MALTQTGTYEVEVTGPSSATGTYSFTLTSVAAADVFAVSIGDTISNGVPSAGAGNIETPGADDEYAFTGTVGQVIRFDDLGVLACCSLYWQLYAAGRHPARGRLVRRLPRPASHATHHRAIHRPGQ